MFQRTEQRLSPSFGLCEPTNPDGKSVSIPFEAQESFYGLAEYFLIGLFTVAFAALLICDSFVVSAGEDRGEDWVNFLIAIPIAMFGMQRLRAVWQRYRFGLAKITVSPQGLIIPCMFADVLPWTETKGVALNGYVRILSIRITSVLILLKQDGLLQVNAGQANFFKTRDNCLIINLRGFPNHNELADAILSAANTYSGTHSPWAGSPNPPFSSYDSHAIP